MIQLDQSILQNSFTTIESEIKKRFSDVKKPVPLLDLSFAKLFKRMQQQQQQQQQSELKVITSAAFVPKRPNRSRVGQIDCGEDAFFVSHHFSSSPAVTTDSRRVCAIGVADGVGGYSLRGIDPSLMAWKLMEGCKKILERDHETTCIQALTECYDEILEKQLVACGGSTACVVSLDTGKDIQGNNVLKLTAANLGDSSYFVIREGAVIYKSEEQTHYFNCPYQLTVPKVLNNPLQDDPSRSQVLSEPIDLVKGDVLIVATDGLTDNVFQEDIVQIVYHATTSCGGNPEEISALIAKQILTLAYRHSRSKEIETPFTRYAAEHDHLDFFGGKMDDITVVVALID
jgi:protein phosphatase PTC7